MRFIESPGTAAIILLGNEVQSEDTLVREGRTNMSKIADKRQNSAIIISLCNKDPALLLNFLDV